MGKAAFAYGKGECSLQVVLDMRTHWIMWAMSLACGLIEQTTNLIRAKAMPVSG